MTHNLRREAVASCEQTAFEAANESRFFHVSVDLFALVQFQRRVPAPSAGGAIELYEDGKSKLWCRAHEGYITARTSLPYMW